MFGSEQAALQTKLFLRSTYRCMGEYRFPLRLRNYYLNRSLLRSYQPANIWDAGCGDGQSTFSLAKSYPSSEIIGTDISTNSIDRCKAILKKNPMDNVSFEVCDLIDTNYENYFDLIVCFEVLEHIEDYEVVIQKFSKALNPNGYLIIHTPAEGKFQASEFGFRKWAKSSKSPLIKEKGQYHVRSGFRLADLVLSLEKYRLTPELTQYTFGPFAMLAHTIYELSRSRSLYMIGTFPFLYGIGLMDWYLPKKVGGGLLMRARKGVDSN